MNFQVCTHFHLLDLLTERGTVTGTVLSGDADLLSAYIAINIEFLIVRAGGAAVRLVILAVLCGIDWRVESSSVCKSISFDRVGRLSGILGGALPFWVRLSGGSTNTDLSEHWDDHHRWQHQHWGRMVHRS